MSIVESFSEIRTDGKIISRESSKEEVWSWGPCEIEKISWLCNGRKHEICACRNSGLLAEVLPCKSGVAYFCSGSDLKIVNANGSVRYTFTANELSGKTNYALAWFEPESDQNMLSVILSSEGAGGMLQVSFNTSTGKVVRRSESR